MHYYANGRCSFLWQSGCRRACRKSRSNEWKRPSGRLRTSINSCSKRRGYKSLSRSLGRSRRGRTECQSDDTLSICIHARHRTGHRSLIPAPLHRHLTRLSLASRHPTSTSPTSSGSRRSASSSSPLAWRCARRRAISSPRHSSRVSRLRRRTFRTRSPISRQTVFYGRTPRASALPVSMQRQSVSSCSSTGCASTRAGARVLSL